MEYQVLYRKYRPTDFDNIIGQEYIINILKQSLLNNKIAHAYLFCGPRGTGKTSTARVFAKAVNCQNIEIKIPCNECNNCKIFENSSDIIEIDAASNNGVDEIRELKNNVKLVPADFKYKIYIIDEVHMLSAGAFNALLKTLEEPPSHVIFILATTEPQKLPITVISRCQKFDFHKISPVIIENRLIEISKSENLNIDLEVLQEISLLCDGSFRDALGMLEMIANGKEKVTMSKFQELISTISYAELEQLFMYIENADIDNISKFLDRIEVKSIDFATFINKFISVLKKKAILIKQGQYKTNITFEKIKGMIFNLNEILYENRTSVSPFTLVEIEILSIIDINSNKEIINSQNLDIVDINFKKSEETLGEVKLTENLNLIQEKINIRINNCFAKADKESLNKYKKLWEKFAINSIESNSKYLQYIIDSECVAASQKYLVILVSSESQSILFNNNWIKIEKEFFEFTNEKILLVCVYKANWDICKKEYINNKKNGKEYKYIEEVKENKKEKNKNKATSIALKIFDKKIVTLK